MRSACAVPTFPTSIAHRLHDQEQVAALAAVPRAVQVGPGTGRSFGQSGRRSDGDPARDAAQGGQRQAAQEEAGETGGVTDITR
jgi:hypothetical protein